MGDNWREITTEWSGGSGFVARNAAGGEMQIGSLGGLPGISPMEMLLAALAGCTGMDVVSILAKKRKDLAGMQIIVRGKRAEDHPKVYTEIEVTYHFWGNDLDEKSVHHAIQLSEKKFCSVSHMLGAVAKIGSSYQIHPAEETIETLVVN